LARASTTIDVDSARTPERASVATTDAIVLLWANAEPHRSAEIAILTRGAPAIIGRGEGDADEQRIRWFRQRPGVLTPTAPLLSPSLSRRQLALHWHADGVRVERVGKTSLHIGGVRTDEGVAAPGDVIRVGHELVLLFTRRPALLQPSRFFPRTSWGDFGEPDEGGIVGESPAIWHLRDRLGFAARADAHVLVSGASGSGKELAARAVHLLSTRKGRPFISRNAATLPAGLVDAELFGNARNYPNAGMPERAGLIGEADGGTLFLDEIGELPSELQAHLLRVLDRDGEYQRLGESSVRRASLRLVAATNRDPASLKHDFLARFSARVELPSLDERKEDILLLARGLLLRAAKRSPEIVAPFVYETPEGREEVRLDGSLVEALATRAFPTNVRDLDAFLWRALADSRGDTIEAPASDSQEPQRPAVSSSPSPAKADPTADEIRNALNTNGGSVPAAARTLGLPSRYALYRLLKKHGIETS
jgi:transcriptional regulator with AAA-type ATPase domain